MLVGEWNWDDAKAVWQEEAKEDKAEEIARKMKNANKPIREIADFTDLPLDVIEQL